MEAYQPITVILSDRDLLEVKAEVEQRYSQDLVIIIGEHSVWLWQSDKHPLAWFAQPSSSLLKLSTRTPRWQQHDKLNLEYLDEVAFFGFGLQPQTIINNIDRLYPGHWYEYSSTQVQCDNRLTLQAETELMVLANPARDLFDGSVSNLEQPSTEVERSVFNQLPQCARQILAPVTTPLLPQLALSLEASNAYHCQLTINAEQASQLGIDTCIGDWFSMFKGKRKILRQRIKQAYQLLAKDMPGADKTTLDQLAWQKHGWPHLQHQMKSLAQMQGKVLSIEATIEPVAIYQFHRDAKPLSNVIESFQRLYFYGCDALKQLGFFMPPLMSKALIKPLLKSPKISRSSLPIMMLTLDHLLRFKPTNSQGEKND